MQGIYGIETARRTIAKRTARGQIRAGGFLVLEDLEFCDRVAQCRAEEHVGREVSARGHAREADCGGESVS